MGSIAQTLKAAPGRVRFFLECATKLHRLSIDGYFGPGVKIRRRGAGLIDFQGFLMVMDRGLFIVEGSLRLGQNTYFNRDAYISCYHDVSIGSDVRFGERLSIHDENHVFEPLPLLNEERDAYRGAPIRVGDRSWIGANVVLLPGAEIGNDCVVAAGSVVRGQFESGTLIAGVPARAIRQLTTRQQPVQT